MLVVVNRVQWRSVSGVAVMSAKDHEHTTRKKKVAMWIGYVGTGFKGLQIHPGHPTVEAELETAVYKAGGILDTNYGDHKKVGWARSSRTDKGVHSLCTVISMKMEVPLDAWNNDVGGCGVAERINAYLPPSIRVFGVAPVSKTFRPRHACSERSYDYFLPPSCLGINEDCTASAVKEILEEFRSQLKLFQGEHPFHNYTIRRLYRKPRKDLNWKTRTAREGNESMSDESSDDDEDEEESSEKQQLVQVQAEQKQRTVYWLHETDIKDRIKASHFRTILRSSCGELESLGDTTVIRVCITGESFMVHQIRKMVGTAVAVTRKLIPSDIISMSLCKYSRIALPIAPPDGLLLASSTFCDRHSSAHAISLSEAGCRRKESFWLEQVAIEIANVIDRERNPWKQWCSALDSFYRLPEEEVVAVRRSWLTHQSRTKQLSSK